MNHYLLALSSAEVHDAWDDGDGHIGFSLGQVERSAFFDFRLHKTNVAADIQMYTSSSPRRAYIGLRATTSAKNSVPEHVPGTASKFVEA